MEMVLVIAICIILAVVVFYSVAAYLGKARKATSKMDEHNSAIAYVTAQIPAF